MLERHVMRKFSETVFRTKFWRQSRSHGIVRVVTVYYYYYYYYYYYWLWCLYNGYRVFPGGKVRPGRDADPSPPSSAEVKNRIELYLCSP
jgi:hypothetical protein